jgi:calcium-dependent protein kinase
VKNKDSGEIKAVKIVKKPVKEDSSNHVSEFFDERSKLNKMDCPNIIKGYDAYEDEGAYYLVVDYLNGMNLLDYLGKTSKKKLNEQVIAGYVNQILNALSHCHSHDIIHGDLRPSNVVFTDAEGKTLKLIDFRYGDEFDPKDPKNQDIFGPPGYAAPEVVKNKEYIKQSDIWSCGIMTYYMFTGELPYDLDEKATVEGLFDKIKAVSFTEESFKGPIWDKVSSQCKKFIVSMLNTDPKRRLTAETLTTDEWLKNTKTTPLVEKEEEQKTNPLIGSYVRLQKNN